MKLFLPLCTLLPVMKMVWPISCYGLPECLHEVPSYDWWAASVHPEVLLSAGAWL